MPGGSVLVLQYKKHGAKNWENHEKVSDTKIDIAPGNYDFKVKTTCNDTILSNLKVVSRNDQHFYFTIKPNPTYDCDCDGVVNANDQEMDTIRGVPVDASGRALDSDFDGVPDYSDDDPYSPKNRYEPPGR
jgi:hypothetical protein